MNVTYVSISGVLSVSLSLSGIPDIQGLECAREIPQTRRHDSRTNHRIKRALRRSRSNSRSQRWQAKRDSRDRGTSRTGMNGQQPLRASW